MILHPFRLKLLLVGLFCNALSINVFAQWSTFNLSTARSPAAATAGTKAIFAGGGDQAGNPSNQVDMYNNATGLWSTDFLSEPKSSMAGGSVGSRAFFAGGFSTSGPSDVIDVYDASLLGWTSANLSEARFDMASASTGTQVFFAGGFSFSNPTSTVDFYTSSLVRTTTFLSAPRASLAGAAAGTKVVFAGGYDLDPNTGDQLFSSVVDIFETSNSSWTSSNLSLPRAYLAAAAVGTKIFFAGGTSNANQVSNVVDIYNTSTGAWTTATLSVARSGLAATTVGTKVFFAGGYTASGDSKVVDIYDNSTGTWSTSTLSVARSFLTATSVGSRALFGGGSSGGSLTSIVDIYDGGCNPILTITPPVSICLGQSTTLTVSGGGTYHWIPATGLSATTGATVTATPTTTTTYQVNDPGLGACASVTVTVGAPIAFSFVSPTQTICVGKSTRLVASGPSNFSWSPSAGLSATTGSIVNASPAVTTTYTVTGSNGTGCSVTETIQVVVEPCTGLTTNLLVQSRWDLAGTSVGNKALFAGGTRFGSSMDLDPSNYSTVVDIYDNSTGTWSSTTLSRGRTELAATSAGTKALFAGGRHEGGTFGVTSSDVVDIYDDATGNWSTANLSEPRHQLAAATVGTKAFFAGGFSYENGYSSTIDIYDFATGLWTTSALSVARAGLTATADANRIYFAGGTGAGGVSNVVDIYDNSIESWVTGASLSEAKKFLASTWLGSKVFFGGGRLSGDVPSSTVDVHDDIALTWSPAPLSEARDFLAAGASGTKVFFGGGYIGGDVTNTIDIYDSSTDTWTTGVLSVDRSNLAAASVGSKIIFAGGFGLNNPADGFVVDVYDVNCMDNQVGVSPSQDICLNSSTVLTAAGANSYTWSPSIGLSATTGSSVTANPTSTQTYTVTGDHGGGCTTTAMVTITVKPAPNVQVTPSMAICIGASTSLTATGGSTYTWSPATGLSATTGSTVTANPTTTTTYTVVGSDASGCTDPATVTVTVNPLPVVAVTPPSPSICPGTPTTLVASGASTYSWSPSTGLSATTGSTVVASPLNTTVYTVLGTDVNNCVGTGMVTILTITAPVVTVTASNSICAGGSMSLTASGAATYTWSPAAGLSATTGTSVTATPATTTTYTVSGDNGSACPGLAFTTITVYQDLVDVTPSMAICSGDTRTLTATGATSYTWSPSTGLSATTGSSVQANPTTTTTYTVTGSYGPGCSGQAAVTVTVNPLPSIVVAPQSITVCSGTSVNLGASGGVSYTWSPLTGLSSGSGNQVTSNTLVNATYTVTGIGANGCSNTTSAVITINPIPTKPVITTTPGSSGHIVMQSSAPAGNQWVKNGAVVLGATSQTLDVTVANEGIYTVVVTLGGCSSPQSDPAEAYVTGVEENASTKHLALHPNPTADYLQVQWDGSDNANVIDIRIIDQSGRPAIQQQLPPQGGRVDLSSLSPGLYLLKAVQGKNSQVQKFVKR